MTSRVLLKGIKDRLERGGRENELRIAEEVDEAGTDDEDARRAATEEEEGTRRADDEEAIGVADADDAAEEADGIV